MSLTESIRAVVGTTFADELRARSDDELVKLFELRPDLITPIPADISSLAVRATSAPSLIRAIESLNRWQLNLLEACAIFEGSFNVSEVVELTNPAAKKSLEELWALGLLYRDGKKYRTPRAIRDILGENLAGLGPSVAKAIDFKALQTAPSGAIELLEKLTWGPPKGQVEDIHKKGTPIEWLLKNHFLIPVDSRTVLLPREVALHLREGKLFKDLSTSEPELIGSKKSPNEIDRAAVAAITSLLRLISELLNYWAEETPTAIQSGGLGIRDLKKTAEHLGVSEEEAGFLAELAYQIAILTIEPDGRILPNANFDVFLTRSYEAQWRELVETWRDSSRVAGLIGRSDSRNIAALGIELDRPNAPKIRRHILEILEANQGISPKLTELIQVVTWRYPHRKSLNIK